ncbi:LysR family transcriptional regulator [Bacillus inaquosorum]|uniref:LysR family transcriptional regulator n=1 Tax=Bacillus inaquosorum TaxID=483913 RepID=UPI00228256BA|nr:LysR family transcriptional regulator [Bacillus inaquosorum]MCY9069584.1 LysR family transcriptional regulator [Bacillus inaquosorum]
MEKRDWIILKTVYEEKNITKAAERLFIAQPTLTYRLQQIEKEFNIKILNRGRRGVEFTQQGEYLVTYAKDMLRQLKIMEENLWNIGDHIHGTIRLCVSRAFALYKLPHIVKQFTDIHPFAQFSIKTALNLEVIKAVYKQDAHIGFVRGEHHWSNEKKMISQETMCIISKEEIEFHQIQRQNRITYNTDPALNMVIDNWWNQHFNKPSNVLVHTDNMEVAKKLVMKGIGYAIVPSTVLEGCDSLHTIVLKDKEGNPLMWRTWMLYLKDNLNLSMVNEFVNQVERFSNIDSV